MSPRRLVSLPSIWQGLATAMLLACAGGEGATKPTSTPAAGDVERAHDAGSASSEGLGSADGRISSNSGVTVFVRAGAIEVNGGLSSEVVARIVRQNLGRFRLCYDDGRKRNPDLAGRVSVRFRIDEAGSVKDAKGVSADLADETVVACIARSFERFAFPAPASGQVDVVFAIVLGTE